MKNIIIFFLKQLIELSNFVIISRILISMVKEGVVKLKILHKIKLKKTLLKKFILIVKLFLKNNLC